MRRRIPVAVAAVLNDVFSGSHATLEALFKRVGVPGDPPALSHASKWKTWLLRANEDATVEDPIELLGHLIEEFMEVQPPGDDKVVEIWRRDKQRLTEILDQYGFHYKVGGRILQAATGPPMVALERILQAGDFEAVEVEFERTLESVERDPATALTAACSLLEALFQAYLDAHRVSLPEKRSIKPLWAAVQKELGLDPKNQGDQDVQRVLSGLASVVDGVGAFRTHAGSAHGGGKLRYRVQPRHARLVANAAHTLAAFVIETWESRESGKKL